MSKWVYGFGDGAAEGGAGMQALLGGKGANLAEMSGLGLPVPPGFTITTEVCTANFENDGRFPDGLEDQVAAALAELRRPVDDFFDHVTVNAKDGKQRVNRLKLLSQIRATMGGIADFGQIEG